jgi:hypothetical protein
MLVYSTLGINRLLVTRTFSPWRILVLLAYSITRSLALEETFVCSLARLLAYSLTRLLDSLLLAPLP